MQRNLVRERSAITLIIIVTMSCWSWWPASAAVVVEVVVGQEQRGEGEGPCPLELAGLRGGEDSGKDSGPVQHWEEEEVDVVF